MDLDSAPEVGIDKLAEEIFEKEPKPPKSIQLFVDENLETVFYMLLELMYKGIKILFPEKNIFELDQNEFQKIQNYYHSFGFKIELDIKNFGEVHPERTDVNELSQFNLRINNKIISYNISFDFLNH
jgi:hypothetical protein